MYTDWLWLSLVSIQKLRLIIKTCQSLGSLFSRLNSWNKVHSHIFDLPIIFLKRLIIKPFGKITLWTFTLGTLVWWLYTNFSFKTGLQISAIVPSTEPKKYIKMYVFQPLHLHISVDMVVVKIYFHDSILWRCHW